MKKIKRPGYNPPPDKIEPPLKPTPSAPASAATARIRASKSYPLNVIYVIEYRKVNGSERNHIWKIKEVFLNKAKAQTALTQYKTPKTHIGGWVTQYQLVVYTRDDLAIN